MKKLLTVLIVLGVLALVGALAFSTLANKGIASGVESFGPKVTKTEVTLGSVDLSLVGGSAALKDLVVGNPEGFTTPSAMRMGSLSLKLKPMSVLSDRIVIEELIIDGPEITYELNLAGKTNIGQILANIESFTGPSTDEAESESAELEIGLLRVTNGKVTVSAPGLEGQEIVVPLPPIEFKDLGKGENGQKPSEILKVVMGGINKEVVQSVGSSGSLVGKQLKDIGTKAKEGLGGFLDKLKGGSKKSE